MIQNNLAFYKHVSKQELFDTLQTTENGLTSTEAAARLKKFGPNAINETNVTWLHILKNQLLSPFMSILFIIAGAYIFTKDFTESIIVFTIIFVNIAVGFYQEYHSNASMQLLKKYLLTHIKTERDGTINSIPVNQLVPGDIVFVYAGDIIPADCRFLTEEHLTVDESSMTGESLPIKKTSNEQAEGADTIGFAGTVVTEGKGMAVVCITGCATALGKIAQLANRASTHGNLEQGTSQLAHLIIIFITCSLLLILLMNLLLKRGDINFLELLLFSAALAITAAPEALPMVTTFCLSRGAAHLKKHNIIVKRLSAIGDLGSIEIFCTDKTGTLTENSLRVEGIYAENNNQLLVHAILSSPALTKSAEKRQKGFESALHKKMTPELKAELETYTIIEEIPFTPQKRRCFSLVKQNETYMLITKGSAEQIIDLCPAVVTAEKKIAIHEWIEKEELSGNRVIALATKIITDAIDTPNIIQSNDNNYSSFGLISFHDPLKATSLETVEKAKKLGVQIKIISGDSKNVCFATAQKLGLETNAENVVLGDDFEKSSEEQKTLLAHNHAVFARVTPEQKYDIIRHLQKKYSVGYIGDGINDAPALKLAHVSFAVNDSAPIAQESAEIILLQNNLLCIIDGIEEGRKVITNILKYTSITTAPSFGHFYALSLVSLLNACPPMLPLQLLLLNLLTDFPMIALSTDTVSTDETKTPLNYDIKEITSIIIIFSVLIALFDYTIFTMFRSHFPAKLQTTWFMITAVSEVFFIFLHRTKCFFLQGQRPSLILVILSLCAMLVAVVLPFTTIGQTVFMFSPPHREHAPWIVLVLCINVVIAESVKLLYYRIKNRA